MFSKQSGQGPQGAGQIVKINIAVGRRQRLPLETTIAEQTVSDGAAEDGKP